VAYNVGAERLLRLRVSQLGRHRLQRLSQSLLSERCRAPVEAATRQSACLHLTSAAFSPDGSRIVTASDDKTARIRDTRLERCQRKVTWRRPARWAGVTKLSRAEMRLAGHHGSKGLPPMLPRQYAYG
jgi:WD40 repeat protein